eukprot:3937796-Rhodomonas_salina.1
MEQVFRTKLPTVTGGDWNVSWGARTREGREVRTGQDRKFQEGVTNGWAIKAPGPAPTYVDKTKRLTSQLDFWAVREVTGNAKQRDMLAGYDHKQIELELPLDVLPAPSVLAVMETRTQPDMRQWARREEDWA